MARQKRTMKWDSKRNCWRKSKLVTLPDGSKKLLRKDFRYPKNEMGYRDAAAAWDQWLEEQYQVLGIDVEAVERVREHYDALSRYAYYQGNKTEARINKQLAKYSKQVHDTTITQTLSNSDIRKILELVAGGEMDVDTAFWNIVISQKTKEATAVSPFIQEEQTAEGYTFIDIANKFLEMKQDTMTVKGYKTLLGPVSKIRKWAEDRNITRFEAGTVEEFWGWVRDRVKESEIGNEQAAKYIMLLRAVLRYGFEREMIDRLPKNLNSRMYSFTIETKEVRAPSIAEVKNILATPMSDPLRLAVLLGLNCGFTQQDILDLTPEKIDLVAGTITRKRGKVKHVKNAPTVKYPLWSETLELIKSGNRNWKSTKQMDYQWAKLGCSWTLKYFRKAGSSTLETHHEHFRFKQLYLGQVSKTIAEKHYTATPQEQFNQAVMWLRSQFLD